MLLYEIVLYASYMDTFSESEKDIFVISIYKKRLHCRRNIIVTKINYTC